MRSTIESQLYRAFNPTSEIISSSPLAWMSGSSNGDGLSAVERMTEDSQIRYLLERELDANHFRVLMLYYTSTHDVDTASMVFDPIRAALIKATKTASTVNLRFVDLVALSEFWNYDLLKKNRYGVLADFGSQFTNCRRRKRLVQKLREWKVQALEIAADSIDLSYIPENTKRAQALA